jgi:iron complex outermembrane receptor protein
VPQHQPAVAGTAQNDTTYAPNVAANIANNAYYAYNLNPFENWLGTINAHFQLSPTSSLDIDPYFWYGFGTGGNQLQTVREGGVSVPASSVAAHATSTATATVSIPSTPTKAAAPAPIVRA